MQRVRLTITLRKDLLEVLDTHVDGVTIRNRSHAIESLLSDKIYPQIKKAIILAADEGIKFRPFTYETPKAMLPVNGRPLLEHIITNLRENDVRDIYIATGYLSDKIISYFGNGSKFGVKLTYILQEKKNVGTAGALKKFQKFFRSNGAFFLIYGDVLADVNYQDMAQFYYRRRNAFAVVGVTTTKHPELWGMVKLKGHNIVEFIEKREVDEGSTSHLIASGIYLFNPKIFKYIPQNKEVSLERDILPKVVNKHKVSGYMLEGRWYDISTPEVYAKVIEEWK